MDSKNLKSLMEAYASVYAPQEVEEVESEAYEPMTKERQAKVDRAKKKAYDADKRAQYRGDSAEADKQFKRRMAMDSRTKMRKEELDIFDTVLEFLYAEGYVDTAEEAEWMMANLIDEEAIDIILDEARRADKEGYARGSKENPKRNDIPHGDVSQRSMLHSKLKRRADEMGRARRSSARNKAGGRTPVGKKEKAFLQAVTRTAGQVRQPNVPDTGRHKK